MNVIIAGDFCPEERVAELVKSNKYSDVLKDIKYVLQGNDVSLLNLECPVFDDNLKPVIKRGPNLKCSSRSLAMIKDAGFNIVTLANNHILDYGEEGLLKTIDFLNSREILYVGAGKDSSKASEILYINKNAETLAIINCCEMEFSIATDDTAGANHLNPVEQWYKITEAKIKANYVIVIVHGGIEHCQFPSLRMQQLYRFFVDAGADAVINNHQHCYSGYELYKEKLIVYGLGNFCFDEQKSNSELWNNGYMIQIAFSKTDLTFNLYPYIQCAESPSVNLLDSYQKAEFDKKIDSINEIIRDKEKLKKSLNSFYYNNDSSYRNLIQPFSGRFFTSLFSRGLIPDMVPIEKVLGLFNYIVCESHRERFVEYLKSRIDSKKQTNKDLGILGIDMFY